MQQQGGSQYGDAPPDMAQFAAPGAHMLGISGGASHHQHQLAEAASPISSRPPPPAPSRQNFEDLAPGVPGSFTDEDALASGEEVERGGVPGNRWPRQETLALLKIRSEMDAAFRDATIKGPLWEDISRKLAELGYMRSAKKCKEKFENVHKYYKRTKEGRAGRQDGKSYRFFTELEALHGGAVITATTTPPAIAATAAIPIGISSSFPGSARPQPLPISAPGPPLVATPSPLAPEPTPTAAPPKISSSAAATTGIMSFSSDTFSSSSSDFDDEDTEEGDASKEGRKRKRDAGSGGGSQKMMTFFEGLMKQVMERQEVMQQRFLETIEKREQDRMIREEAWKRQEMARLTREHELMAQERAMAASRDAAVISYLQRISGQSIQLPPAVAIPAAPPPKPSLSPSPSPPPPPPPPPQQHRSTQQPQQPHQQPEPSAPPLQQQPPQQQHQRTELVRHQPPLSSNELVLVPVPVPDPQEVVGSGGFEGASTSSRWPKSEVHALIKLRSGLDPRYQESGPKGPLWEEISAGMQRLGYNRSSKRCKEKWENINKYFKKVKESNRKRPEDAKTCPYFHQLDALYRQKLLGAGGVVFGIHKPQDQGTNPNTQERSNNIPMSNAPPPPPATQQNPHPEIESKKGNSEGVLQIQASNGGVLTSFFGEGASSSAAMKKPADIVKETMEQQQHQKSAMDDYEKMDEHESDSIDDDDDDEDDAKMQYKIEFQRPNVGGGGGNASAASAAGSFLAMVQ